MKRKRRKVERVGFFTMTILDNLIFAAGAPPTLASGGLDFRAPVARVPFPVSGSALQSLIWGLLTAFGVPGDHFGVPESVQNGF